MTVHPAAGLDVGDRGQIAAGDVTVKIVGVNDMGGAKGIVGHDLRLILKRVADVAILVAVRADGAVVELVLVGEELIPLIAVVFPRDVLFEEHVGDAALARGWNGERRVVNKAVGVSVGTVAKISGIVVVQQIVVAFLAVRADGASQRAEVIPNGPNARLRRVGAVAVTSATVNGGSESSSAVSVLSPPVVGARDRVGVLNFVHSAGIRSATPDEFVVRRLGRCASSIAKPDGVAKAKHDAVGASAAHDGLVIVVAHRITIGEFLEIGHVTLQDVVEAHGGRAFTRCFRGRRIIGAEVRRLRRAIYVGADGQFGPGEKISKAAAGIVVSRVSGVAIELLPHLVEAMDGAGGVGVPRKSILPVELLSWNGPGGKVE